MTTLLWFKRDLRVSDHPALVFAAQQGPILPLYVFEPEYWAQPDVSGRQFEFLCESVFDLAAQLKALGLDLAVRVGAVPQVLEELRLAHGVTSLVSHEETGNGWTYARDRDVADWARGQGVVWTELAQSGVVRRLNGRDGWAATRNRFVAEPQRAVPRDLVGLDAGQVDVPPLTRSDYCPKRQIGGREQGLSVLGSFLTHRGETYRRDMSSPLAAEQACSRLSPYLAYGCLSGREAAQAGAARQREVAGGWGASLKSFQSRLAWRDHFMQKLEDEPALEHRSLHPAYEGLRGDDTARREAWEKGETGLPFVDACMRYLAASGWINFRMRAMLMAVASYHLWLDWRATGLHLAREFTDFEPGIHWPQVQMQSGTTGMNTVRIYNPIKQGLDQDPTGRFTRRWVPELEEVPDIYLQEPWKWDGAARLKYPAPIVDVASAARFAREQVYGLRKNAGHRREAARVIDKHASRKDPQGHFVNDRASGKKPKQKDPRQGAFDF